MLREFAKENFGDKEGHYLPVVHGRTQDIKLFTLVVRESRYVLERPFKRYTYKVVAVMIRIWIFYLNYYESRPFVVGQTSIRKLTSNLDKFRFDRHVLIRYSVFNRNLQPADLLCQQRCDIASALHGGHTIGDKQREFLKFVGVFSQCHLFR